MATIDLLFISDTSYQQRMGSQNAELADLANIVTVGNDAYAQSNALVQLRMAGYQRLSVDWTNVTLQDLLSDLKLMGGSFATTWAQTVLSGADVPVAVSAFTAAKGSFCGLGTVGTFNSAGLLSTGLAGGAAIAMARGSRPGFFCEDITLSHEVGHVMGSLHDRANATGSGAFSYSYGYGVANGPNPFGDIMSYLKPRQPYFSSPGLFTCLGQACGTATDDAVRTFNQTAPAVEIGRAHV